MPKNFTVQVAITNIEAETPEEAVQKFNSMKNSFSFDAETAVVKRTYNKRKTDTTTSTTESTAAEAPEQA